MKNNQPNVRERAYTAVKVRKCSEEIDNVKCASDPQIEKLLDQLVFTMYFTTGVAVLGETKNYGKNPIKPTDQFYQQFQLNLKSYRDNNNFVTTHHVRTNDNRFNVFSPYKEFEYTKIRQGPVWIGKPYFSKARTTYDGGKTFRVEKSQIIYGAYIFLSSDGTEEERDAFNILDFLSELGGIMDIILFTWVILAQNENEDTMLKQILQALYFTPKQDQENETIVQNKQNLSVIKFCWKQKFNCFHRCLNKEKH